MRKLYFIGYPRLRISGGDDGKVVDDRRRHRASRVRSSVVIIDEGATLPQLRHARPIWLCGISSADRAEYRNSQTALRIIHD